MKSELFKETQLFSRGPIAWIFAFESLMIIGIMIWMGTSYADASSEGGRQEALTGMIVMGAILILSVVFVLGTRMETIIRHDGLYVRYRPFLNKWKHIHTTEIAQYESLTYDPIGDFGGWGIKTGGGPFRHNKKYKCYTVYGDAGIRLTLSSDMKILIGTQRKDAFYDAMRRLLAKHEDY